jgi:hypothetical protein
MMTFLAWAGFVVFLVFMIVTILDALNHIQGLFERSRESGIDETISAMYADRKLNGDAELGATSEARQRRN